MNYTELMNKRAADDQAQIHALQLRVAEQAAELQVLREQEPIGYVNLARWKMAPDNPEHCFSRHRDSDLDVPVYTEPVAAPAAVRLSYKLLFDNMVRAQGFPADYVIDRDIHGRAFTKEAQVARCGNSVSPPMAEALVRANMGEPLRRRVAA